MLIIHIMEVKLVELIRIKDLEKKYKTGVTAIYDFDLKVKKGDFVFVIGQSGSGKSTLIKLLYREEKPTNGSINIGGIEVAKLYHDIVKKINNKYKSFSRNNNNLVDFLKFYETINYEDILDLIYDFVNSKVI